MNDYEQWNGWNVEQSGTSQGAMIEVVLREAF
jgi:hypothetical protein